MHAPLFILLYSLFSFLTPTDEEAEIVFAGDAMQHQGQLDAARRSDGSYDYSGYFADIKPYVENADYAVVNLECPLGGRNYSGYPCFCAPDEYARELSRTGFDMFLLANNHILDRRDSGLLRTIDALDTMGYAHTGAYRHSTHRAERMPHIVDIKGFKVAFLNYTYGTNGFTVKGDAIVNYTDRQQMADDVTEARKAGAEIVTACVHWGEEYRLLPTAWQKSLADYLVDLGVDLVIGGHPHVIQPMEMRQRQDGSRCLVVYSLGNFISNMKTTDTRGGAMVKVKLTRDANGSALVDSASYRLVFTVPPASGENYRLVRAENCNAPQWTGHCKRFTDNAERIFNKNNIDVPRDTTAVFKVKPMVHDPFDNKHKRETLLRILQFTL